MCHVKGTGSYEHIDISENAYDTHAAHGDARIGEAVPGKAGYVLDDTCTPVEAPPKVLVAAHSPYLLPPTIPVTRGLCLVPPVNPHYVCFAEFGVGESVRFFSSSEFPDQFAILARDTEGTFAEIQLAR